VPYSREKGLAMHRKRYIFILLTIGIFVIFWTVRFAMTDTGTRKIVKIYVQSQEDIQGLANIVEPLEVRKGYVIADVTDRVLQEIRDKGFSIEIIADSIENLLPSRSYSLSSARQLQQAVQTASYHYHSYSELKTELQQLEAAYPEIAKVIDIGDSWEKTQGIADRDILALKISDNVNLEESEPEILFIGAHHAREWISVEVPFYLAKYLVENYATDSTVKSYVDNGEIWIVPMLNPDGHQYSIDVNRAWRKNRRDNGDGSYGVDLNRNYSYMWGGLGSSSDTWADLYRGASPFSEPETQAIRDLALSHEFRTIMSYHNSGQLILYPWSHKTNPAPHNQLFSLMATDMAGLIEGVSGRVYTPQQSSLLYLAGGTTEDWGYGEMGIFTFTTELRPLGAPYYLLPEDEIMPTWEENKPAALHLISWSQLPAHPIPDIKANGSDGPVTATRSEGVIVKCSLNPGMYDRINADWWVLAKTPMGWYYRDLSTYSWKPGQAVTKQGPLYAVSDYQVLNRSGLQTGSYTFYCGVDLNMNGGISYGTLYYDSVTVQVTP